jgi:hypothetical protein
VARRVLARCGLKGACSSVLEQSGGQGQLLGLIPSPPSFQHCCLTRLVSPFTYAPFSMNFCFHKVSVIGCIPDCL